MVVEARTGEQICNDFGSSCYPCDSISAGQTTCHYCSNNIGGGMCHQDTLTQNVACTGGGGTWFATCQNDILLPAPTTCESIGNCSSCIGGPSCVWCGDSNIPGEGACIDLANTTECPVEFGVKTNHTGCAACNPGFAGPNCTNCDPLSPAACSYGLGVCFNFSSSPSDPPNYHCVCEGRTQPNCSTPTCFRQEYNHPVDSDPCSLGRGTCQPDNTCSCQGDLGDYYFAGAWCQFPVHQCHNGPTANCSGLATAQCLSDYIGGRGGHYCKCDGYEQPECNIQSCFVVRYPDTSPPVFTECAGHGTCDFNTRHCFCNLGYGAPWCENRTCAHNNTICSNVTTATCGSDGIGGQVCSCTGYTFPFCANHTCKIQRFGHETPDATDCGGQGTCNATNQCVCSPPFQGQWCEDNPFGCNPVGTINVTAGTCVCKPGYGGQYCCQLDYSQPFPYTCQFCNPGGLCNCTGCGATSFCNPLNGTCNCFNDPAGLRAPPSCCLAAPGWGVGPNGTFHTHLPCGGHGTCTNTMFPYDGACDCFVDYTVSFDGCSNGPCGVDPIFGPTSYSYSRCGDNITHAAYCNDTGHCVNCPPGTAPATGGFSDVAPGRCCPLGLIWLDGVVVNDTCGVSTGHASCLPDGTCQCQDNGFYTPGGPACTTGPCDGRNAIQCNGHGICGTGAVCSCFFVNDTSWDGFDCNHNVCDDPFLYPGDGAQRRGTGCCLGSFSWINGTRAFRVCGGHGTCDPSMHTCTCVPGYSGTSCANGPCGSAPEQCHGHGTCNTTACTCDAVSFGPECNANIYCGLYDQPCNGFSNQFASHFDSRGVCNGTYGCICTSPYYTGQICETITGCNADRTIRYNKTTGLCDCIPGLGFGLECCAQNCSLGCGRTGSGPDCRCPNVDGGGECRDCDRLTAKCFCRNDLDAVPGMCCPLALNTQTNNITDICGGRGTCDGISSCACNAGFGGQFCCVGGCTSPASGVCRKNPTTRAAFCDCLPGSDGISCQNHGGCPSVNMFECSRQGVCSSVSVVEYAHLLGYINQPDGNRNMDLLWGNLTRLYLGFSEDLPSQYLPIQDGTYFPGQDFSFAIMNAFASDPRLSDRIRFFRNLTASGGIGISDWLFGIQRLLLADLGVPNPSYMNTVIGLMNVTDGNFGPGSGSRVVAILDQMLYGMRLDFDIGVARVFTSQANVFECLCNATATSASCSDTCPLSPLNGIPCTGLYFGDFHGACQYSTNLCVCGSRYLGAACDIYRGEGCFKNNLTTTVCEGRGVCNQIAGDVYGCDCNVGLTGPFCDIYTCSENATTLIERMTQCHNFGICGGNATCTCDVATQLALSHTLTSQPVLPVGQDCQYNAIRECGVATLTSPSVYTWTECDGHGRCLNDSVRATPYCKCNNGFGGQYCNITICPAPGCNTRETCDENNGVCVCNPTWDTPAGSCANSSISCRCLHSKCGHGVADQAQLSCVCNKYYRKDVSGSCTIVQCPLVLLGDAGERPCNTSIGSGDRTCGIGESSHPNVCCYDACVSGTGVSLCTFPTLSQLVPNCSCDPIIAFTQSLGICYSKCHGHPYSQIGNNIVCQCDRNFFLFPRFNATNEFMTITDCTRRTCLHGGTVASNGQSCKCVSGFTGTTCQTAPLVVSSSSSSSSSSSTHSSGSSSSSSTVSQSGSSTRSSSSSSSGSSSSSTLSSSSSPSSQSSTASSSLSSTARSSSSSSSSSTATVVVPAAASSTFWTPGVIAGVVAGSATAAAGLAVGIYYAAASAATPTAAAVVAGRARFRRMRSQYYYNDGV